MNRYEVLNIFTVYNYTMHISILPTDLEEFALT